MTFTNHATDKGIPAFLPCSPSPAMAAIASRAFLSNARQSGDAKALTELMCFAWDSYKHGPVPMGGREAGGWGHSGFLGAMGMAETVRLR